MLKIYKFFRELPARIGSIEHAEESLRRKTDEQQKLIESIEKNSNEKYHSTSSQLLHIKQILDSAKQIKSKSTPTNKLQADDHFFDDYYKVFEDRFRGSEEVIARRLRENYSKLLKDKCKSLGRGTTAIDIGSGRGEMLALLQDIGFKAIGIDLNSEMVELSNSKGLESIKDDAISYLKSLKDSSVSAITGIHIVEHLPFESLFNLISECRRVLVDGGFVLFETPNPENVTVGAYSFWFDSSHLKPIPPLSLNYMADYIGFKKTQIIRMRPVVSDEKLNISKNDEVNEFIQKSLLGPVDYALFAEA